MPVDYLRWHTIVSRASAAFIQLPAQACPAGLKIPSPPQGTNYERLLMITRIELEFYLHTRDFSPFLTYSISYQCISIIVCRSISVTLGCCIYHTVKIGVIPCNLNLHLFNCEPFTFLRVSNNIIPGTKVCLREINLNYVKDIIRKGCSSPHVCHLDPLFVAIYSCV